MAKKNWIDRALAQVNAEIAILEQVKARIEAQRVTAPRLAFTPAKRTRKKAPADLPIQVS